MKIIAILLSTFPALTKQLNEREEALFPIYHTVAVTFADLHDRAGRMQEKGVISVSSLLLSKSKKFLSNLQICNMNSVFIYFVHAA